MACLNIREYNACYPLEGVGEVLERERFPLVLVSTNFKMGGTCRTHGTAATMNGTATHA